MKMVAVKVGPERSGRGFVNAGVDSANAFWATAKGFTTLALCDSRPVVIVFEPCGAKTLI
jgi:hypothetical protein